MDRIGRSRSNIDADQGKVLARELGDLRRSIVDQLLPALPGEAVERLWQLLGLAPAVLGRLVYGATARPTPSPGPSRIWAGPAPACPAAIPWRWPTG